MLSALPVHTWDSIHQMRKVRIRRHSQLRQSSWFLLGTSMGKEYLWGSSDWLCRNYMWFHHSRNLLDRSSSHLL